MSFETRYMIATSSSMQGWELFVQKTLPVASGFVSWRELVVVWR